MPDFSFLSGIVEEVIGVSEIKNTDPMPVYYFLSLPGRGVIDMVQKTYDPRNKTNPC
jgi:hypothetical protein